MHLFRATLFYDNDISNNRGLSNLDGKKCSHSLSLCNLRGICRWSAGFFKHCAAGRYDGTQRAAERAGNDVGGAAADGGERALGGGSVTAGWAGGDGQRGGCAADGCVAEPAGEGGRGSAGGPCDPRDYVRAVAGDGEWAEGGRSRDGASEPRYSAAAGCGRAGGRAAWVGFDFLWVGRDRRRGEPADERSGSGFERGGAVGRGKLRFAGGAPAAMRWPARVG